MWNQCVTIMNGSNFLLGLLDLYFIFTFLCGVRVGSPICGLYMDVLSSGCLYLFWYSLGVCFGVFWKHTGYNHWYLSVYMGNSFVVFLYTSDIYRDVLLGTFRFGAYDIMVFNSNVFFILSIPSIIVLNVDEKYTF